MSDPAARGALSFDVDARHIQQLGRELVENKVTAVVELIKNSYDADALTVVVAGFGSAGTGGKIIVVDDGVGMDLESVSQGWMRLSSDEKEREPLSPRFGRRRAGRKGIGRFSTQTLASSLNMLSKCHLDSTSLSVDFFWDRDYVAGKNLDSIENYFQRVPGDPKEHGTALSLNGLNESWQESDWERVREAAMLLQPPFGGLIASHAHEDDGNISRKTRSDPGFRVVVLGDLPVAFAPKNPFHLMAVGEAHLATQKREFAKLDGAVEGRFGLSQAGRNLDEFLSSATAHLKAWVTPSGELSWQVTSAVLDIDETRKSNQNYAAAGPFLFEAAYFIYRSEAIGDVKVRVAQEMGRQYGGVRIYRDGLRVMPYGEPSDDWLGLNQISASRGFLPPFGVVNMFGAILIGRVENPRLVDTASREGIVEGAALEALRDASLEALKAMALSVAAVRERKAKAGKGPRAVPAPSRTELIEKFVAEVGEVFPESEANAELLLSVRGVADRLKQEASDSDRRAAEARVNLIGEISMLRILASLGTASTVFSHEVSGALHRSRAAVDDAVRASGEGTGSSADRKKQRLAALARVDSSLVQLGELSSYIVSYTSESRRRDRKPLPCARVVKEFVAAFSGLLNQRSITISYSVEPRSLRTAEMARSELEALLFNLLSNAVKALDRDSVTDRRISIDLRPSRDGRRVVMRFEDSGVGISAELRDRVFDPFVTMGGSASPELGTGTGLGLAVVRDIVDSYSGRVFVSDPSDGMSTCFEVRLPRLPSQFTSRIEE